MTATAIESTAFHRLETEARLVKPAHKGPTAVANRFGYRGDIQLTPEIALTAVIATAQEGEPSLSFLAGQLENLNQLPALAETLGDLLGEKGKYFIYVADLPRGDRFQIALGGVSVYALPYDDVSVYNELIDFFYLDKMKLKKFDTAAKIDAVAEGGFKYDAAFPALSYEQALARI